MDIKFCIPSYKRSKGVSTLDFLENMGVEKSNIFISVQTASDLKDYSYLSTRANLLYREGVGVRVSFNRNTLLNNFDSGTKILMLDDDITDIIYLSNLPESKFKTEKLTKNNFNTVIDWLFEYLVDNNIKVFGVALGNPLNMRHEGVLNTTLSGTVLGIIKDDRFKFDETLFISEDFDYSLQVMKNNESTIKFLFLFPNAAHWSKGGCDEFWGVWEECDDKLAEKYSDLIYKKKKQRPNSTGKLYSMSMKHKCPHVNLLGTKNYFNWSSVEELDKNNTFQTSNLWERI